MSCSLFLAWSVQLVQLGQVATADRTSTLGRPICFKSPFFFNKLKILSLFQSITNRDTGETLLCTAYVFEVSTSEHGAQHHIYKLVKDWMSSHHFFFKYVGNSPSKCRASLRPPSAICHRRTLRIGAEVKWTILTLLHQAIRALLITSSIILSVQNSISKLNFNPLNIAAIFFFSRFIYFTLDISWPTKNQHLCLRLSQVSELFRKKYRSRLFLQNKINRKEKISTIFFSDNVSKMSK